MADDPWVIIVSIIIFMVMFGYVSSKLSDRKRRKAREASIPETTDSLKIGVQYNVHLSDGRKLLDVEIKGSVEHDDTQFTFAGYEGLVVLLQKNGKKVYVKKTAIRYIEEV